MQDQCPCIMDHKCATVFMQLVTKKYCWFHEMLLHPVYADHRTKMLLHPVYTDHRTKTQF